MGLLLVLALWAVACVGEGDDDGAVFAMSVEQIEATFEIPRSIGTDVNDGLDTKDRERFVSQFVPGAKVIDPIAPNLTPGVGSFFSSFQRLCTNWTLSEVLVNQSSSLTVLDCVGFYDALSADDDAASSGLPDGVGLVRHLPITDGLATELMHRFDAETAGSYAVESATVIGFPESVGATVSNEVAEAEEFIGRFEQAWASQSPESIAGLYAEDGIRHDTYVTELSGPDEISDWVASLLVGYPELAVTTESLYASGRGPAAIYELTMSNDGEPCAMRLGSVWDLNPQGQIVREFVHYDTDTIFACGWAD